MRVVCACFFLSISLAAASAADLKVKITDPQSAAVRGAQVSLFSKGTDSKRIIDASVKTVESSAEGIADFGDLAAGAYRIKVLAPGFAAESEEVPDHADLITIRLRLATASETVVVTATRTPAPAGETGASISTLQDQQLETMRPVAADDAVRYLPGAVVNSAGQRGGLSSLFVRGGDSTYNKVIVDGVTINEPGGTFDFGTLPLTEASRMEFVRGAQSTLYGSDAMTSVVQVFTRAGSTQTPEIRLGADGGNFSTANGYASFAGAEGRFDYNLFGDQFDTEGAGINNAFSDSLEGLNVGAALNDEVSLRLHLRHSNSHTGLPGEWSFNGDPLLPPDPNEWSQLNSLLGSLELTVAQPSGWQHRFTGFDYLYRYNDVNLYGDPARVSPIYGQIDFPDHEYDDINRAGFEYQGDYSERALARIGAHSTFGY
ncbi:MAG: TonB-dependent receptor plug domain-containing protein, partial [Candidatus Sulfotelmatobacter sp.]